MVDGAFLREFLLAIHYATLGNNDALQGVSDSDPDQASLMVRQCTIAVDQLYDDSFDKCDDRQMKLWREVGNALRGTL